MQLKRRRRCVYHYLSAILRIYCSIQARKCVAELKSKLRLNRKHAGNVNFSPGKQRIHFAVTQQQSTAYFYICGGAFLVSKMVHIFWPREREIGIRPNMSPGTKTPAFSTRNNTRRCPTRVIVMRGRRIKHYFFPRVVKILLRRIDALSHNVCGAFVRYPSVPLLLSTRLTFPLFL
jgi:hypothetical protein